MHCIEGLRFGVSMGNLAREQWLRLWWNWQTRYFEVVVAKAVQVQVLLSAPIFARLVDPPFYASFVKFCARASGILAGLKFSCGLPMIDQGRRNHGSMENFMAQHPDNMDVETNGRRRITIARRIWTALAFTPIKGHLLSFS